MNIARSAVLIISCIAVLTSRLGTQKPYNKYRSYKNSGYTQVTTFTSKVSETTPAVTEPVPPPDQYTAEGINMVWQNPELPTGCEITSLTMLLNYLGFNISKTELAEKYLTKDYMGKLGFDEAFQGDPTWSGGFGCYSPVIAETAAKYLKDQKSTFTPKNISGTPFKELYSFIASGRPVIAWASMDLIDVNRSFCYVSEKGKDQYWYENEHCMLLIGYNKENNTVTAADPLNGIIQYNADRFEYIYDQLEKQAVIIETE